MGVIKKRNKFTVAFNQDKIRNLNFYLVLTKEEFTGCFLQS